MANSLITAGEASASPASTQGARMSEPKDTRVFMYREGEARMFNSPDEVPKGEGWVDHPDKVQAQPPKRGPGRPRKEEAVKADDADTADE